MIRWEPSTRLAPLRQRPSCTGSPKLDRFSLKCQETEIPVAKLQAMLLVKQPSMQLAALAAQTHCYLLLTSCLLGPFSAELLFNQSAATVKQGITSSPAPGRRTHQVIMVNHYGTKNHTFLFICSLRQTKRLFTQIFVQIFTVTISLEHIQGTDRHGRNNLWANTI